MLPGRVCTYIHVYSIYTVLHIRIRIWQVSQHSAPIYIYITCMLMYVCGHSVLLKEIATQTVVGRYAES